MAERLDVSCPRCGATISLPFSIRPTLTYAQGNGSKGFLTAEVGIGGMEHTCRAIDMAERQFGASSG